MKEFFDKTILWVKSNWMIAAGILLVLIFLLFPKMFRGLLGTKRRIKHRPGYYITRRTRPRTMRRSLPRSVGLNRNGSRKKAWQIKGSQAARRHMAQIRRLR